MVLPILARLVLAGVLLASGIAWEAPPVFISALFVGGSVIPLAWRAGRDQGRFRGELPDAIDRTVALRVQEAEERQEAELSYLEERYEARFSESARRLADLEERLEYAERVLGRETQMMSDPGRKRGRYATPA